MRSWLALDDFVPVFCAFGSEASDPWIVFFEGLGALISGVVCVVCAEDTAWFPSFDPGWDGGHCAGGGYEDGCALGGFLEGEGGERVEATFGEEDGIRSLV